MYTQRPCKTSLYAFEISTYIQNILSNNDFKELKTIPIHISTSSPKKTIKLDIRKENAWKSQTSTYARDQQQNALHDYQENSPLLVQGTTRGI